MPTKNQLQSTLKRYGLKVSGNKQQLIQRIHNHEQKMDYLKNLISKGTVDSHTVCTSTEVDDRQCAICFAELAEKTAQTTLECSHSFCTSCILRWFQNNNTCPCCRAEVPNVVVQQSSNNDGYWRTIARNTHFAHRATIRSLEEKNSRLQSQIQSITQERNRARNDLRELEEKYKNAEIRLALLSNNLPESEFRIVKLTFNPRGYMGVEQEYWMAEALLFARYKVKNGDYVWMLCDRGWRGDGSWKTMCTGGGGIGGGEDPDCPHVNYEESLEEWIRSLVENGLKRNQVPKDKEVLWDDNWHNVLGTYDIENDRIIPIRDTHQLGDTWRESESILSILGDCWEWGLISDEELNSINDNDKFQKFPEKLENIAYGEGGAVWRPKTSVVGYNEVMCLEQ